MLRGSTSLPCSECIANMRWQQQQPLCCKLIHIHVPNSLGRNVYMRACWPYLFASVFLSLSLALNNHYRTALNNNCAPRSCLPREGYESQSKHFISSVPKHKSSVACCRISSFCMFAVSERGFARACADRCR